MNDLSYFLKPKNIAVIGVSRQGGFSWGRGVFDNIARAGFNGKLFPVNPQASEISGFKAYPDMKSIPDDIDLSIITVPVALVPKAIEDSIEKGVKAIILITAGYAETSEGKDLQKKLTKVANQNGIRIVGPNVSGIFNVSENLDACIFNPNYFLDTPIAFICQGGYAIHDLIYSSFSEGMGVGKFMHTGNECDVTCTDFLEYIGDQPDVKVVLVYIEGLRDGRRFLEVAQKVSFNKPVIVLKAGGTEDGARAASSHTGAIAGADLVFDAAMRQANIIRSPKVELMLQLGHAFLELPPLLGRRIGVVTMGGSWGVIITDALNRKGLSVPELSSDLQEKFQKMGMPYWASTKNPVDLGAAGASLGMDGWITVAEKLMASNEVDCVLVHGFGQSGYMREDSAGGEDVAKGEGMMIEKFYELKTKYNKPLLVCSFYSKSASKTIDMVTNKGIRIFHDMDDTASILDSLCWYYERKDRLS